MNVKDFERECEDAFLKMGYIAYQNNEASAENSMLLKEPDFVLVKDRRIIYVECAILKGKNIDLQFNSLMHRASRYAGGSNDAANNVYACVIAYVDNLQKKETVLSKISESKIDHRFLIIIVDNKDNVEFFNGNGKNSKFKWSEVGRHVNVYFEGMEKEYDSVKQDRKSDSSTVRYLIFATEWSPSHGGLSAFNAELAKRISGTKNREVYIAFPEEPNADDKKEMGKHGIKYLSPVEVIPGMPYLSQLIDINYPDDFHPDVIIGHGRITGPYAYYAATYKFKDAQRVHFVHTLPGRLETAKGFFENISHMNVADERKSCEINLSVTANVVVGVGAKITNWISDQVNARISFVKKRGKVVEFIPGIYSHWRADEESFFLHRSLTKGQNNFSTIEQDDFSTKRQKNFLLIARAEDVRTKGIDIAVESLFIVNEKYHKDAQLQIRGVVESTEAWNNIRAIVSSSLKSHIKGYPSYVEPLGYTVDEDIKKYDFLTSSCVLMPSTAEGFGLSAYEGIGYGVPVLISRDSGLAELLLTLDDSSIRADASSFIVSGTNANIWADKMFDVISNQDSYYSKIRRIRQYLIDKDYWGDSIENMEHALDI